MSARTRRLLGAVATSALLLVLALASRGGDADSETVSAGSVAAVTTPTGAPTATTAPSDTTAAEPSGSASDTDAADPACVAGNPPTIDASELPDEAIDTLELIDGGGPFPYDQDGATFQNRERLLPQHPRGYYREYTVETPGSDDRGARRIVTGDCGEEWYTDDHYDSFDLIVGWS